MRYCRSCGRGLVWKHVEGRERRFCPSCERVNYRNPKPCAGALVVDDDSVLLVKRTEPPAVGSWSVPAGYLEADEPPTAAALRELEEETSIRTSSKALELLDTVFVQNSDSHSVLVIVYVIPVECTDGVPVAGDDAGAVRFWNVPALRASDEQIEPGYESVLTTAVEEVTET